jgi:hypothetical protein
LHLNVLSCAGLPGRTIARSNVVVRGPAPSLPVRALLPQFNHRAALTISCDQPNLTFDAYGPK